MEKTKRDSIFEILRILCMVLIVVHHFSVHGNYQIISSSNVLNIIFIKILQVGGKVGVNTLILISGYFLILGSFKFKKFLKLILEVSFYSISIYLLFVIFGNELFSFNKLFSLIIPLDEYWFIWPYLIMYSLSQILNKLLKNRTEKEYILIMIILFIIQRIFDYNIKIDIITNTFWFINLYIFGAYIRVYPPNKSYDYKFYYFIIFILCYCLMVYYNINNITAWKMRDSLCILSSLTLFLFFVNLSNESQLSSKFINMIATTTFGIYLIHENSYIRKFLYIKLLNCPVQFTKPYFPIFLLFSIVLTFVACILIDLIRQYLIEKPIFMLFNHFFKKAKK
jgi:hypothetical protein